MANIASAYSVPPSKVAMAFVDAGYLTAGAQSHLRLPTKPAIDGDGLATWAKLAYRRDVDLLRTYVYDAQYPEDADRYPGQRAYFDALAAQPGLRLRIGHLVERSAGSPRAAWQQKGVDTLLVLDLVRMAQLRAFDVALVIAGDRDLAEALRVVADDHARRVILFSVEGSPPAKELVHAADDHGVIRDGHLRMLVGQPLKRGQRAALEASPAEDPAG
jgi:uncharacterized LabA/DUF88 family protein